MFIDIFWLLFLIYQCCRCFQQPKLAEVFPKKSLNFGAKFIFHCTVEEGIGPFQFQWKHNGQSLQTNTDHQIETAEDRSMLKIAKITDNDSGNYSCLVTNDFGQDFQQTLLLVKGWIFLSISKQYVAQWFGFIFNIEYFF